MHGNSRIGSHSVLSYIDVQDQVIPDNVVLHGLKQRNGKFMILLPCRRLVFLPVGSFPGKDILWVKYWNVLAVVLLCILR